jgi:hypothetical protein
MSTPIAIVEGTLMPDGRLELEGKVNLPAGRVQVTLVPMHELSPDDPFWRLMQGIWAGQLDRGHVARSAEDVEAERRTVREEWEERMARISRLQREAERLRDGGRPE